MGATGTPLESVGFPGLCNDHTYLPVPSWCLLVQGRCTVMPVSWWEMVQPTVFRDRPVWHKAWAKASTALGRLLTHAMVTLKNLACVCGLRNVQGSESQLQIVAHSWISSPQNIPCDCHWLTLLCSSELKLNWIGYFSLRWEKPGSVSLNSDKFYVWCMDWVFKFKLFIVKLCEVLGIFLSIVTTVETKNNKDNARKKLTCNILHEQEKCSDHNLVPQVLAFSA